MQRRLIMMDGNLVRHAQPVSRFIEKHNALHEGARYQHDPGGRGTLQLSRPRFS